MTQLTPLDLAALEAEYNAIVEALKETNFNKTEAARILKIDRKTLYNKINKYKDHVGLKKKKIV